MAIFFLPESITFNFSAAADLQEYVSLSLLYVVILYNADDSYSYSSYSKLLYPQVCWRKPQLKPDDLILLLIAQYHAIFQIRF